MTATFDGQPRVGVTRIVQGLGHGPVLITRKITDTPTMVRAWCLDCAQWVGPDRSEDPHALHLAEDDACAHLHKRGGRCRSCEACLPDGALYHRLEEL